MEIVLRPLCTQLLEDNINLKIMIKLKNNLRDKIDWSFLLKIRPAFISTHIKQILNIKRTVINTRDGKYWIDPISNFGYTLLHDEIYEPDMHRTLNYYLRPSSIFVDVGANEGYFSVIGKKIVGELGRVYAIEPQERLIPVIKENFRLNETENIIFINSAISDSQGTSNLYLSPDTNTGSTGLHQTTKYKLPTQKVKTGRLNDLFLKMEINHVDLMKIDIEGFEYEAILGSKNVFQEKIIKVLALELHPKALMKRGHNPEDILNFLKYCGYKLNSNFNNNIWTID